MTNSWQDALTSHALVANSFSPSFWSEFLAENPDVLHRILGDLYQIASKELRENPTLDDLWALVAPSYSLQPFPQAFMAAAGKRSIRQIAGQLGIHHSILARYINEDVPIVRATDPVGSLARLEAIALTLKVHPAYFAEWRRLWVLAVIDSAMESQPNLSVGIYRKFSGQERRAPQNAR